MVDVKKLRKESAELADKREKLKAFVSTDEFEDLSYIEKHCLIEQLNGMEQYQSYLDWRINIYSKKSASKH